MKTNPRPWQTLSKQTLLSPNKFLTVEQHAVRLPDGQVIPDWPWVIVPNAVIVLVQLVEGTFLCFRQTKYAVEGITLAPVGGMLEPGEEPLDAAKRELREELGCQARRWVSLGSYVLEPNRGVGASHLFLALEAVQVAGPASDDLEDQERVRLTRGELEAALWAGEFKVLPWAAAVSLALNYLGKQNQ